VANLSPIVPSSLGFVFQSHLATDSLVFFPGPILDPATGEVLAFSYLFYPPSFDVVGRQSIWMFVCFSSPFPFFFLCTPKEGFPPCGIKLFLSNPSSLPRLLSGGLYARPSTIMKSSGLTPRHVSNEQRSPSSYFLLKLFFHLERPSAAFLKNTPRGFRFLPEMAAIFISPFFFFPPLLSVPFFFSWIRSTSAFLLTDSADICALLCLP